MTLDRNLRQTLIAELDAELADRPVGEPASLAHLLAPADDPDLQLQIVSTLRPALRRRRLLVFAPAAAAAAMAGVGWFVAGGLPAGESLVQVLGSSAGSGGTISSLVHLFGGSAEAASAQLGLAIQASAAIAAALGGWLAGSLGRRAALARRPIQE